MNFTTYIRRAAKYTIYLAIVFVIILVVMRMVDDGAYVPFIDMIGSERGLFVLSAIVIFALIHPFLGYNGKVILCNAEKNKDEVVNVMAMCGYKLTGHSDGVMTFRAVTLAKKIILLCEDTITITTSEVGTSRVSGPRREVVRSAFRIDSYVK